MAGTPNSFLNGLSRDPNERAVSICSAPILPKKKNAWMRADEHGFSSVQQPSRFCANFRDQRLSHRPTPSAMFGNAIESAGNAKFDCTCIWCKRTLDYSPNTKSALCTCTRKHQKVKLVDLWDDSHTFSFVHFRRHYRGHHHFHSFIFQVLFPSAKGGITGNFQ
jgi:hypothetical protein